MKFNFSFTCLLQTGHTSLQRAAAEGHLEIVKTLLENGISVDHQDEVVSDKNYEVFDANNKFFVINIMCEGSFLNYVDKRRSVSASSNVKVTK